MVFNKNRKKYEMETVYLKQQQRQNLINNNIKK